MGACFHNPILPGFYPDPSICRVGEDFYLVNSSFGYFPGLPIFHSRDLTHWRQLGHVLDRPSQLALDGVRLSDGLFAPTIRYHQGAFYVINTMIGGREQSGNFIVTAANPAGPWSDPHWLPEAPGIDPSLFFDDDGTAWYCGNRPVKEPHYPGHCEIWLQKLDLAAMRLAGEPTVLSDGALKGAQWAEGPHLYHINGWYYLLIAEGGTGHNHAVTVMRSRRITGPYEGNPRNPILTHRHLGLDYPLVGVGHADLVATPQDEWWLVCLGMRPYGGYFHNLGRETFLVPVRWEEDWPVASPGIGRVELTFPAPCLPEQRWPLPPVRDQFDIPTLAAQWNFIRTPRAKFWSLTDRPGHLRLRLRPQHLAELTNPSFVGRRQQHINFTARLAMEFAPTQPAECAGLVLLQNENFHFRLVAAAAPSGTVVRLIKREKGDETMLAEHPLNAQRFYLAVTARGQDYSFYLALDGKHWLPVAEHVDGRVLSSQRAGGFVGAYLGMYASSQGQPSANHADFDWFEYARE